MLPVVAGAIGVAVSAAIAWVVRLLVIRLIVAFGLSIVSYVGYVYFVNEIKGYVANAVHSMPADIYQLFLMSGAGTGLGWVFSALTFRVTMSSLKRLTVGN
ncbi:MAG: DUF2523 domain-containing protein [Neisseriaceae bacterium]|nr:DUF2523 domain-containing protein [Neisseriaceae bacterium]